MADWYPQAIRDEGPPDKQGYTGTGQRTEKEGAIGHSMVGPWSSARRELFRPSRRASWTFSLLKDGSKLQHYPIRAVSWHGGSRYSNEHFVGIECEGGPIGNESEPLTPIQTESLIALLRWLGASAQFGWTEWTRRVTLWEHNEQRRFGSPPTACPSGRIPWASIITALEQEQEDEPMTDAERREFDELKRKVDRMGAAHRTERRREREAQNRYIAAAYAAHGEQLRMLRAQMNVALAAIVNLTERTAALEAGIVASPETIAAIAENKAAIEEAQRTADEMRARIEEAAKELAAALAAA